MIPRHGKSDAQATKVVGPIDRWDLPRLVRASGATRQSGTFRKYFNHVRLLDRCLDPVETQVNWIRHLAQEFLEDHGTIANVIHL